MSAEINCLESDHCKKYLTFTLREKILRSLRTGSVAEGVVCIVGAQQELDDVSHLSVFQ